MTNATPAEPASGGHPASGWVRFLRSYGPTPSNTTLFDEYTVDALRRANVSPLRLTSPLLEQILARVDSGLLGSILIAGTAGDGKTYHARSLWSHLGGTAADWTDKRKPVKEIALSDGRMAVFVKDLTELSDSESDEALGLFEKSVLDAEDKRFVVLVANHGQILERLRECGRRQGRLHPLRVPIQEAFLQRAAAPERLALFDLSRQARAEAVEDVLRAVSEHPEWTKCGACSWHGNGRVCPILENRNRILGADDQGRLRKRMSALAEISRANGTHLPIRDLLALASNMILGHPEAKEGLMSCSDVPKIQVRGTVEMASIYDNVFGANLKRRASSKPIFRALAAFGLGSETTNGADGLMVYGADDPKLKVSFDNHLASDPVYGATPSYLAGLHRYLEGDEAARVDDGAADFLVRLASQRRRLFFVLPKDDPDYRFWSMTAFRFAGDYLDMMSGLAAKRNISDALRSRLVRGLNRVMTGLLIENTDKLFVASSGGFTQSRISVLCDTESPARRTQGVGMKVALDGVSGSGALEVAIAEGASFSASLQLTPVRFEFLSRVAEGALPGSFSNECLEDMLAFKARLLRKAELAKKDRSADDEDWDDGANALTLRFIEIEMSGHGYSKPVTVRTPQ
ncbi:MAG: hypothetical protein ABL879_11525 [Devosia sp.]